MNQAESSSVEQLLLNRAWTQANCADEADLILINTCSVRITAETRALTRISHFCAQKKHRELKVLVMGCMAERLQDSLKKKYKRLDFVVGMFERDLFSDIFESIEQKKPYIPVDEKPANSYFFASSSYEKGSFQSYVPIMNGCNNFCTYCIVPYVRGREVSRPLPDILVELDLLADKGVREITLLGQNVNSYNWEDPITHEIIQFPQLLQKVSRHIEDKNIIRWIRFMSSHPKDLSNELIEVIAQEKAVCKLLHLPVQNGSNRILEQMNRKYTKESYLSLVTKIRNRIPSIALSTDILVGFPGETEEDLQDTLDLMNTVKYDAAFMYHYNPREGTVAFDLANRIPEDLKKARLDRVIKLQHATSSALMKKRLGTVVDVLVESVSRNNPDELFGHTEMGEMVVFSDKLSPSLVGSFVKAELSCLRGRTFRAKMIEGHL